jgi:hypothetical protein
MDHLQSTNGWIIYIQSKTEHDRVVFVANRDVHSTLVNITLDGVCAVFRIATTNSVKGHSAFFD